ncbi:MAG: nucleoside phosphorylase [Nitrososphaeria archaeon]
MPMQIKAEKGEVADRVVAVEDRETAEALSFFLENSKLVNRNRDLYVYTGMYKGSGVSIATHGIGAPSATLVFDELSQLGVKLIIRLGTAKSLSKRITKGDVVVSSGASYIPGGTIGEYVTESFFVLSAVPDLLVSKKLLEKLTSSKLRAFVGPTFSNDLYYSKYYENNAGVLADKNFLCADMECASLFVLSYIRGFRSACALIVTEDMEEKRGEGMSDEDLKKLITRVAPAVLDALVES